MPEIRFQVEWPDGSQEACYSPSLIVKDYFSPNQDYTIDDFVTRSREALQIASDRVQAKYGFPCGLAIGQLQSIERRAQYFNQQISQQNSRETLMVRVIRFIE